MSEVRLAAAGISARRGGREVLHDVELTLRAGEIVALLGPNGAGKSTLLDVLAGSLPASSGTVSATGRVAIALQSAELARRSVLANLTAALAWWGVPRAERRERALAALELLGARALCDRPAGALSGGERRRVHLARVLALDPEVLLLDEPFAGLDGRTRDDLLADTAGVLRAPRRATLIVVHDRAEAWALADRLLVLLDGRLVADGAPAQVLAAPPSPEVARFLGYDGELREAGGRLLTRPADVVVGERGSRTATVERVVATEDGARLRLVLPGGHLMAFVAGFPPPQTGDEVAVEVVGGVRFGDA